MLRTRNRGRYRGGVISDSIMDNAGVYGNLFIYAMDSRSTLAESPDPWTGTGYNTHYFVAKTPHSWAFNKAGHVGILKNGAASCATGGVDTAEFIAGSVSTDYARSLASDAKNVIMWGECNDRGSANLTYAQSVANFTTILNAWTALGKRVYLFNGTPYEDLNNPGNETQRAYHLQMRDWLQYTAPTLYPYGQVISVNSWDVASTSRDSNEWVAGYDLDGLHEAILGGYNIGITALAPMLTASVKDNGITQTWRENATGVINTNAAMTGTGGTIGTRWANGGNGCPDSWSTGNNGGAAVGITCTLSKETRADGFDWWKVVVTGTPTATAAEFTLSSAIDYTQITADQWGYVTGYLEWENAANIHTICLQAQAAGGTTKRGRSLYGVDDTNNMPTTSGGSGKHRSATCQRIAGTTSMIGGLFIRTAAAATTTTATIWFRDVTARVYSEPA